jgi:hypothetical protein
MTTTTTTTTTTATAITTTTTTNNNNIEARPFFCHRNEVKLFAAKTGKFRYNKKTREI